MTRIRSSPMLSSRFITRATWSAERDSSSMRAEDITAAWLRRESFLEETSRSWAAKSG